MPTLSASIDQANLQVNGNQVINSADKTTEVPLNLIVNTNNKTGYTATLNSETNETALVNNDSMTNAKINSIDISKTLTNFSENTWGVKIGNDTNFSPIPKLTTPMSVIQTTSKTNGDETNNLEIGLKLGDNLESGNYNNKLIFSILTNNYEHIAIMMRGMYFREKLEALGTATSKIEHFKKSTVAPTASMNAVNIEDWESDYEIKLWLDPTNKTAYYYAEPEKVYLNTDSGMMFFSGYFEQKFKNILEIDLSNFDTSKVTNMGSMFVGMRSLTTLNLSNFNTSQVADMSYMFSGMSDLTTLDLSNFDTSQVMDMSDMFSGMSGLTTLDLSSFDTSKVTDMEAMFANMSSLISLNLSNFDTSKVTSMGRIFFLEDKDIPKDKLERIYVNNDFNTDKLTNTYQMFGNRKKLRGGNGSYLADPSTADKTWLRVDRPGVQGYFTRKS